MIKLKNGDMLEAGHFTESLTIPNKITEGVFVRIKSNNEVWMIVIYEGEERFSTEISHTLISAGWTPPNVELSAGKQRDTIKGKVK